MKKFFAEFREFINKGNVLDMAVGVIIATAFGAITSSLINDIFMPLIGLIFGGGDMAGLNIALEDGTVIGLGNFIGAVINFIVVALIVFCIVKAFNAARKLTEKKQEEAEPEPEKEPEPTKEELLLTEIRDLLKKQK